MPENRPVTTNPVDVELIQRTLRVFEILAREVARNVDAFQDANAQLIDDTVNICGRIVRSEVPPKVAVLYQRNALQRVWGLNWIVHDIFHGSERVKHEPALATVLGTYVMGACAGKDAIDEVILMGLPWSEFAVFQLDWPAPTTTLEAIARAAGARQL